MASENSAPIETKEAPEANKEMVISVIRDPKDGKQVKGVAKRKAEHVEAQLDACLDEEKAFRKKRWMTLIKKLASYGVMFEPEHISVGPKDGIGLKFGHSVWDYIELAHNGLYYTDGDYFDADAIVRKIVPNAKKVCDYSEDD